MMVNDPIGDMLTRIRNAAMAHNRVIEMPNSKLKMAVATLLSKKGYVKDVKVTGEGVSKTLHMELSYDGKEPVVIGIKRVSKPGLRWYVGKKKIPVVMGGAGISVVSTPKGVMTGKEAIKLGVGGELLCEVW
ncbi:MAG: 30S ribosomal protein S8 [Patescibacteria group bacterium]